VVLDAAFAFDGMRITSFGGEESAIARTVPLSNDKLLAVGSERTEGQWNFALARYHANGKLDRTFGDRGRVVTDLTGHDDWATSVRVLPDGRIVVAGYSETEDGRDFIALARYRSDGRLDRRFGRDGKVLTDVGQFDRARALVWLPEGKLLVAGSTARGDGDSDLLLVRYRPAGALDRTFGKNGMVRRDFGGSWEEANDVLVLPSGRIVVGGASTNANGASRFLLAAYRPDGRLDRGFGREGVRRVHLGGWWNVGMDLARQADGKLVLGGYRFTFEAGADFAVARFHPDGRLDQTFSSDGKTTIDLGSYEDYAYAVAIQPNQRIIVGGYSATGNGRDFALVRLSPAGKLLGKFTSDFARQTDIAFDIVAQADGKVLLAGASQGDSGFQFALARFDFVEGRSRTNNAAPVARLAVGAATPAGVVLDASASFDPNQPAATLSYRWDLNGNGVFGEEGEIGPTAVFVPLQGPGAYTVWLTVVDALGLADTLQSSIIVG
jgi:uncharacterized delta-60 repeat protein